MHAYTRTGEPAYYVQAKAGHQRATTIADCRKHGYLPSVSEVIRLKASPALESWKVANCARASLKHRPEDYIDEEAYIAAVVAESREVGRIAADRGTEVHDALETAINGGECPPQWSRLVDRTMNAMSAELGPLDWVPEVSFGHPLGYGGRVDISCAAAVADFKTKDKLEGRRTLAYDDHVIQLAAYGMGLGIWHPSMPEGDWPVFANIFIGVEDEAVKIHRWKPDEVLRGWRVFEGLLSVWKLINKYDPAFVP